MPEKNDADEGPGIHSRVIQSCLQNIKDLTNNTVPNPHWLQALAQLITLLLNEESDHLRQMAYNILRSDEVDTAIGELRIAIRGPLNAAIGEIIGSFKGKMHAEIQAEIDTMQHKMELARKAIDNPSALTQAETEEHRQAMTEFHCNNASDLFFILHHLIARGEGKLLSLENLFKKYVRRDGSIPEQSE